MGHIKLNVFVKAHPVYSKMRKRRGRKLRPVHPSKANELWYKVELLRIVKHLRKRTEEKMLPLMKRHTEVFQGDSLPPDMKKGFHELSNEFGGIEGVAKRLSQIAVRKNLEEVDRRLIKNIREAVGVDIKSTFTSDGIREAMAEATKANIELITSIPVEYFEKLETAVERNFVEGIRFENLADIVQRIGDVTESRAKLIARDQTSKMNGSFNQIRQSDVGIERYEWQTAGDERVRETHAENDGKIFRWDDPPAETGHPGEDINCRCVAIPYFDLDEEEEKLLEDNNEDDDDEG